MLALAHTAAQHMSASDAFGLAAAFFGALIMIGGTIAVQRHNHSQPHRPDPPVPTQPEDQ